MPYLQSNIPHFTAWVRREYTKNLEEYHGDFLHAMVVAVTTMPNRTLSFQVIFTGCESDDTDEPNVHGGAMWARMPLLLCGRRAIRGVAYRASSIHCTAWDCMSHYHSVYKIERASPAPWIAKVDGEFYPAKYYFTVDYTDSEVADHPAQHKQSHTGTVRRRRIHRQHRGVAKQSGESRILRGLRQGKARPTSNQTSISTTPKRMWGMCGIPSACSITCIRTSLMSSNELMKKGMKDPMKKVLARSLLSPV